MCVFSSHSFWTSSSLDVPAGVTQEEGHTGFLIHLLSAVRTLIFLARRIQPSLSLVDREVELLCTTNDLIVFHPLGICFFVFFFLVRKILFAGIELTSQRVRGLRGTSELPGRPADYLVIIYIHIFQGSSRFTFLVLYRSLWFPRTTGTNCSRLWFSHYRGWSMDGSGETRFAAVRFTVPGQVCGLVTVRFTIPG